MCSDMMPYTKLEKELMGMRKTRNRFAHGNHRNRKVFKGWDNIGQRFVALKRIRSETEKEGVG